METRPPNPDTDAILAPMHLPRICIQFCTQCKWMLRAAYFAQELLSTFSTSLGEVSLIPSTGGVFIIDIVHLPDAQHEKQVCLDQGARRMNTQTTRIWDRKANGGFPETKNLKKLVRDIIDPSRILGHVDRAKSSEHDPPPTGSYSYEMNAQLNAAQAPKALAANEDDRFSGNQEEKGKLGIGEERHIVEPAQEQGQGNEDGRACEDCD